MRRSVMISPEAHQLVFDMASEFECTQSEVVEAALKSIDRRTFKSTLTKLSKQREEERKKRLENRRKLADLSKELTDEEIEELLKQAKK